MFRMELVIDAFQELLRPFSFYLIEINSTDAVESQLTWKRGKTPKKVGKNGKVESGNLHWIEKYLLTKKDLEEQV